MKVLGVSGSPIKDSNTDRAVKAVLAATGHQTEFVKLIDYDFAPCKASLGCVKTNRCVIKDDGILLAEKAKEADALVIGAFTPYSTIDARTKAFIERLYPLRHRHGFMAGKPGGAVVTSCLHGDQAALPQAGRMAISAIQFYMMEEGMEFLGAVEVPGNVPCIRCGQGDTCKMSGITMISGPDATVESIGVNRFEDQPAAVAAADDLGQKIGQTLAGRST